MHSRCARSTWKREGWKSKAGDLCLIQASNSWDVKMLNLSDLRTGGGADLWQPHLPNGGEAEKRWGNARAAVNYAKPSKEPQKWPISQAGSAGTLTTLITPLKEKPKEFPSSHQLLSLQKHFGTHAQHIQSHTWVGNNPESTSKAFFLIRQAKRWWSE